MPKNLEYITWNISNFESLIKDFADPFQIKKGGFMLCLEGSCYVVIDAKQYHITQRDIVVAFPYSVLQLLSASENCRCVVIGVSMEFFAQVQIPNKSFYFTNIREHPSISLNENELAKILTLSDMFITERQNTDHAFRAEINESILNIILYETAAIYNKRKPNTEEQSTRDSMIFNSYIFQLFRDFKTHRNLSYYADNQSITPNHLSKVIKRITGRSASEWLVDCVIMNIKHSLQNRYMSITQISEEFNFANNSFFSQYFKKYTGMTPRQYRESLDSVEK